MTAHVAICMVGYRNADDIVPCVAALGQLTYPDFELIICENGGPEAHAALSAALPDKLPGGQPVRVVLAPGNLGYAGGVNVCIGETAQTDAWWVLNPDTIPEPAALAELVRRLEQGDCQMVGGVMVSPDGAVESFGGRWRPWFARAEAIGRGLRVGAPLDAADVHRRLSYIPGGSMLFGRAYLDAVGPMREDYFLYCEEVEWGLRGLQRGLKLGFAPGARVLHNKGTTTGSGHAVSTRPKLPIYLDERNKILVTRDRYPARLPVAAAASLLLILLRYARRAAWRQTGYALQGWTAGLLNRRGVPGWIAQG
jgi:hypothetical protein